MSYLKTDADGTPLPATPAAPKQFVVYPIEGQVGLPDASPVAGYREALCYRSQAFGSPLWVEIQELLPTEIEVQRDGSIALHFNVSESSAEITVVPRDLTAFVRVFATLDEAVRHALAQNTQLTAMHERWLSFAKRHKLELEARYGRAAAPNPLVYRVSLGQGSRREAHVMDAAQLIGRMQRLLEALCGAGGIVPVEAASEAAILVSAERLP